MFSPNEFSIFCRYILLTLTKPWYTQVQYRSSSTMVEHNSISREHLPLLSGVFSAVPSPFSEHTAGNIFLYRKAHEYKLIRDKGMLAIRGISYDKISFLMPLSGVVDWDSCIELAHAVDVSMLYPIDEALWPSFREKGYKAEFSPSDSDYMYERHSLEALSGRMLAKKKNLYSQFTTLYQWHVRPLDASTLSDAHAILQKWYTNRPDSLDEEAMYDGLRFFEDLRLLGWVVYVDNEPAGIHYGEIQPPSTFVVHCSKALPHRKGLGAFLHIESTKALPSCITTLNWEQDLGLEGLRHAKYTFQPSCIRKKGRIFLK